MNALSKISISDLTVEERLELIEALWDSLENEGLTPAQEAELGRRLESIDQAMPVPDWHLVELERRMETFEQDTARSLPWEQFREQLAKKHGF